MNQKANSSHHVRLKKVIFTGLLGGLSIMQAIEFGTMGNVSASMGGAGVALKSPFALYYNPALIASDSKMRLGYSFGVGIDQSNLDKLTNIKFSKIMDSLSTIGSQMADKQTSTTPANPSAGVTSSANNLKDTLVQALKDVNGNHQSTDLDTLWQEYQQQHAGSTNHSQLASALSNAVQNSNMSQDQKNIFKDFADSVDWSDFDVSNGKITHVSIKSGSNGALDSAMQDLNTLYEVLKNNGVNLRSQSGIVYQLSNKTLQDKFGSIAIGLFNTTQAGVSLVADSNRMRLIFGDSDGYYELEVTDNGYIIRESTANDYRQHSILQSIEDGNAHKVASSVFNLIELPVGYAYNFNFSNKSNLSIGITTKFMLGTSIYSEQYLNRSLAFQFNVKDFTSNSEHSMAFGIDVGAYYGYNLSEHGELGVGFVVKNLNSPIFKFDNAQQVVIKPQYRAGLAYNGKRFSLAFDADILPNEVLNYSNGALFSQMVGGGFKIDYSAFDIRGGLAYDLKQDNGVIFTVGVNVLGFIDIAAEAGTKWVDYFGVVEPKYANVRIGGSFSW